jgi:shikimate kinase
MDSRSNLVLIGLPAAGKSTLGVLLAKRLSFDFLDTDLVMQARGGRRLQAILDADGADAFRRLEEQTVLALEPMRTVIATGGSVVYGERAMEHLRRLGRIIYLYLARAPWQRRLRDLDTRGVVRAPGQSLASLYAEREPLYRRWAEIVVDVGGLAHPDAVERLARAAEA